MPIFVTYLQRVQWPFAKRAARKMWPWTLLLKCLQKARRWRRRSHLASKMSNKSSIRYKPIYLCYEKLFRLVQIAAATKDSMQIVVIPADPTHRTVLRPLPFLLCNINLTFQPKPPRSSLRMSGPTLLLTLASLPNSRVPSTKSRNGGLASRMTWHLRQ